MNILNFLLLLFAHYLIGWGIIRAIGFKQTTASLQFTLLSLLFGLGFSCLLPILLEMGSIAITKGSLATIIIVVAAAPFIFWIRSVIKTDWPAALKSYLAKLRLYDLIFVAVLLYILGVSMFKCYYFPPTPRDLTSGAEAIAEYTIREHKIDNSYFTLELSSTDNYQKPPFLLGLQIIYKTFVQPFGQVWLIALSLSFFLLLYTQARKIVHPVIAGVFTLLVLITPEFYAYTIMPLFDFPNTVYLFVGFYYLYTFIKSNDRKFLLLSSFGFGLATMARPETIFLTVFICPVYYIWQAIREKKIIVKPALLACILLMTVPVLVDLFTMEIFVKHFIHSALDIGGKVNPHLADLSPFFKRWDMLINLLMFTDKSNPNVLHLSSQLYAETFDIMLIFIALEAAAIVITRKVDFNAACWFVFLVLVFILLGFIGYLLLWTEYTNAKRGLFKLIPLIFYFGMHTRAIQFLSKKISSWELT